MVPKKKQASVPPAYASGGKAKSGQIPIWPKVAKDGLAGIPMFKSPGFKQNRLLVDRLQGLKTQDVAFISAGLAVLLMAPLAEYMIASRSDSSQLHAGFDRKGGMFPDGSSPYEDGTGGLAPGGLMGQESDVITPLDVRDPRLLILRSGDEYEPAASPAAPPAGDSSGWRDAIQAAERGVTKAVKKAKGIPRPSKKMTDKLKDWRSSLSGSSSGGGPSMKLEAPKSGGLFGKPRVQSGLIRGEGYLSRGGGSRGLEPGSHAPGLFDGSRYGPDGSRGDSAASIMTGSGIPGGGTGYLSGGPVGGGAGKDPRVNSDKGKKTVGESLAYLRAKMEMEKALELKWAKKKYEELERKKMIEQTALQTAQQAFMKVLDKVLNPNGNPDGKNSTSSTGEEPPPAAEPAEDAGDAGQKAGNENQGMERRLGGVEDSMGTVSAIRAGMTEPMDASTRGVATALDSAISSAGSAKKKLSEEKEKLAEETKKIQETVKEYQRADQEMNAKIDDQKEKIKAETATLGKLGSKKEGDKEIYDDKGGKSNWDGKFKSVSPPKDQNPGEHSSQAISDVTKSAAGDIDAALGKVNAHFGAIPADQRGADTDQNHQSAVNALNNAKSGILAAGQHGVNSAKLVSDGSKKLTEASQKYKQMEQQAKQVDQALQSDLDAGKKVIAQWNQKTQSKTAFTGDSSNTSSSAKLQGHSTKVDAVKQALDQVKKPIGRVRG